MTNEENIQKELSTRFAFLSDKIKLQRPRRIFVEVPAEKFSEVLEFAIKGMNFSILCAITGYDDGLKLNFLYHLASDEGIVLSLRINAPREKPLIKTVTKYFPSADLYERELMDLLGAQVEGLPAGRRYPLPEDWPQGEYPLRKDWKMDTEVKEVETDEQS